MKKRSLQQLALIGLLSGILLQKELTASENGKPPQEDLNKENADYHLMTEDELMTNLNAKGRELYNSLSPEGKALALREASRLCNGTNECRGMNACKTDMNDCAGKAKCKSQSKCAIGNKNLVIKLVSEKMAQKRQKITQ